MNWQILTILCHSLIIEENIGIHNGTSYVMNQDTRDFRHKNDVNSDVNDLRQVWKSGFALQILILIVIGLTTKRYC